MTNRVSSKSKFPSSSSFGRPVWRAIESIPKRWPDVWAIGSEITKRSILRYLQCLHLLSKDFSLNVIVLVIMLMPPRILNLVSLSQTILLGMMLTLILIVVQLKRDLGSALIHSEMCFLVTLFYADLATTITFPVGFGESSNALIYCLALLMAILR